MMEPIMDNDFIRQVYYHSLTLTHEPIKYIPIDFTIKDGDGNGDGYGKGYGKGYGDGCGNVCGNGYGNGKLNFKGRQCMI